MFHKSIDFPCLHSSTVQIIANYHQNMLMVTSTIFMVMLCPWQPLTAAMVMHIYHLQEFQLAWQCMFVSMTMYICIQDL